MLFVFCNTVLISTYWNVNILIFCNYIAIHLCFNLNLLECKYEYMLIYALTDLVLISTYWNVNVGSTIVEHNEQGF